MLKRNMNASGIFYAVGVVFSIVGATLASLVLLYWAMLYTEQFEILVLTPTGEVNAKAVPWLAILLYLFGRGMRWMAGERFTPSQTLSKLVSWPAKYCGTHYAMKVIGWELQGSAGFIGLWMRQQNINWCVVAYRHSDMSYKTRVVDYLDLDKLDPRVYWVHEPLAPLNEITPETQRIILESQLNKRLTDLF